MTIPGADDIDNLIICIDALNSIAVDPFDLVD